MKLSKITFNQLKTLSSEFCLRDSGLAGWLAGVAIIVVVVDLSARTTELHAKLLFDLFSFRFVYFILCLGISGLLVQDIMPDSMCIT